MCRHPSLSAAVGRFYVYVGRLAAAEAAEEFLLLGRRLLGKYGLNRLPQYISSAIASSAGAGASLIRSSMWCSLAR